ncbi:MAG: 3-phosphoshikimate 1-carboxyvinyltransferase [Sedimentibacter sp.]|uniref:3-phosphoshikimate 1-carboxyvinyltransferase n=1 Tax=Sedimentibacter sp. TaxID=1960295 RepID=UPI003159009D
METIKIKPATLSGKITVPPSKSMSHRAVICAGLSDGESTIEHVILSEDIKATIEGMRQLGATIQIIGSEYDCTLNIKGSTKMVSEAFIDCRESGSTLRFLIPVGLMLSKRCTFTGSGKLVERPLNVFYEIFEKDGVHYKTDDGKLPLESSGVLKGGHYNMTGTVSSQFVSGLLFSLPLLESDSTIEITDKMESKGYIDLTLSMLENFGVHVEHDDYMRFHIKGNSKYEPSDYRVEGDYSQAAFFIVAREVGNHVECLGLNEDSLQGDKEITRIVRMYDNSAREVTIDASQIPDLVPVMAVLASLKDGVTTSIVNAGRLRIKESDRLKAISTELKKIGADVCEKEDGLVIRGRKTLKGNAMVNSWNDHRIAMSLAIAATRCEKEIILDGCMAVTKSYPHFWDDYKQLGGDTSEFNDGQ